MTDQPTSPATTETLVAQLRSIIRAAVTNARDGQPARTADANITDEAVQQILTWAAKVPPAPAGNTASIITPGSHVLLTVPEHTPEQVQTVEALRDRFPGVQFTMVAGVTGVAVAEPRALPEPICRHCGLVRDVHKLHVVATHHNYEPLSVNPPHNPWDDACSKHLSGEPSTDGARCLECRPHRP